jgi:hypothetical protein
MPIAAVLNDCARLSEKVLLPCAVGRMMPRAPRNCDTAAPAPWLGLFAGPDSASFAPASWQVHFQIVALLSLIFADTAGR